MRRRNHKTRRYGALDPNIEKVELTPLEPGDEDDDNTLFDLILLEGETVFSMRSLNISTENRFLCPRNKMILYQGEGNLICTYYENL